MKKIVSFLLALMLALSLAACSAKSASNDSASMASDSYDFNGAEMPDMEYGYTSSDDGAWDGQSVSSPAADLAERGVHSFPTDALPLYQCSPFHFPDIFLSCPVVLSDLTSRRSYRKSLRPFC